MGGYEDNDMRLFSVILTPTLSTLSRMITGSKKTRIGNNRVQTDSRFSMAWEQIHNKMTAKYQKDIYNEMCCGPFALLFALIELETSEVNPYDAEKVKNSFDALWKSIREKQVNDPFMKEVMKMYGKSDANPNGKTKDNAGTYPTGLLETINNHPLCEGFTAKIEIREEALKHFPILRSCIGEKGWNATKVDEFTKPEKYERAMDWIVHNFKPYKYQ